MRLLAAVLLLSSTLTAVNLTKLAAATTIAVNALDIHATMRKARAAAKATGRATKKGVVKVAKKVTGR